MAEANQGRDRWGSRTAFIMAAVGSAVGLGNVWRFPVVCYKNGGGAFFIPYLIALLTAGIPLMILEYGIGQKMQGSAPAALKKTNQHTEWVGWFALLVGTVISFYYTLIMAYSFDYLYYAVSGLISGGAMPWSASPGGAPNFEGEFFHRLIRGYSMTETTVEMDTAKVLAEGSMWSPVWFVILGIVMTWVAVYAIICRGVHRVGKVVMWTVPLPAVVLLVLAIRGLTLPGAAEGVIYYLRPNFAALRDPATWLAAYGQIFFSLTLGFGVMIAYASYRPKTSDITNNAFITSFANCVTSFIAGFAVFSVIGFLALKQGKPVEEVMGGGPGLVFVTYPTAISKMGEFGRFWPPVVGILFFVMLLFLGIDSLFSLVEGAVAGLRDRFPGLCQAKVAAAYCAVGLISGVLVFGNRAGLNWLDIFDHWANDYGLVVVGLLECLIIGYFYRTDELRDYINEVSEIKLWGWWELCIRLITPAILIYLIGTNLLNELGREELYGATGGSFDQYLYIAPLAFFSLFLVAFALARMWTYLALVGGGACVAGICYAILRDWGAKGESTLAYNGRALMASVFCGVATAMLIGGLLVCLRIAKREETGEAA